MYFGGDRSSFKLLSSRGLERVPKSGNILVTAGELLAEE
jgi:hypothetical protein